MLVPAFDAPIPILALGVAAVVLATMQDVKTREVPDSLTSGLIALGFASAILRVSVGAPIGVVINSIIGFAFGYGVGALLYYAKQWGGGDAKLLAGIGALFGFFSNPAALSFVAAPAAGPVSFAVGLVALELAWLSRHEGRRSIVVTLSVGALIAAGSLFVRFGSLVLADLVLPAYLVAIFASGALWAVYKLGELTIKHRALEGAGRQVWLALGGGLALAALISFLGFSMRHSATLPRATWDLATLLVGLFMGLTPLLLVASKRLETTAFRRSVEPRELVLGDWLAEDLVDTMGRVVIDRRNPGLTAQQIGRIGALWKKGRVQRILIKDGIPFVPAFLMALLAMIAFALV